MSSKGSQGSGDEGVARPAHTELRRWEAVLPRDEIAVLLAERRLDELLSRIRDARVRWPRDLELLRSMRVLEDHLKRT